MYTSECSHLDIFWEKGRVLTWNWLPKLKDTFIYKRQFNFFEQFRHFASKTQNFILVSNSNPVTNFDPTIMSKNGKTANLLHFFVDNIF
jgi:hypothetical protein